ncbi:MAG: 50S ribosomal protein L1 [Deltaproteobacteria bacterium]|nr:50S ribosomal protein L1 [Deltaproteobacteria bacterium]
MTKRHTDNCKKIDEGKTYRLDEALALLESCASPKFDESVDVALRLGIDPKKSDQMVRGSVGLPHGLGKKIRVVVFAKGEKAREAESAGAEVVGAEDLVERVQKGWLDFDKAVATPDMMATVSKVGKILGPRGLMPNPKMGTVTIDIATAVKEAKAGRVEFRIDKGGIVHAPIGRKSFGMNKLKDNFQALLDAVTRAKPAASKGQYLRTVTLSTTMGPGIAIEPSTVMQERNA